MKALIYLFLTTLLLSSCADREKILKLEAENDSLRNVLALSQSMLYTLQEVGSLIDSIDLSRNALRVNIIEGTTRINYNARLKEINSYVKRSGQKISALEKKLKAAGNESGAYQMMIAALKDELAISSDEIRALEARVNKVLKNNKGLNKTVKIQQANLEDFQLQLDTKYHEVKLFELQIQELTDRLKISEAESYFAQAQALELAARRTRLAPGKKRETYRKALGLYKKALKAGNLKAKKRIKELEKIV